MTFNDLRALCSEYGLEPIDHPRLGLYYIHAPLPRFTYLGKFDFQELANANPRDVEAQIAKWSLGSAFEMC